NGLRRNGSAVDMAKAALMDPNAMWRRGRSRRASGLVMLVLSSSHFDPKLTSSRMLLRQVGCPHHCYSINSSAIALNLFGTLRWSAFAVLRLMTSSNLVGC